ncbi:MAG: ShlB/FhaC/HecB family hemolysin secretion/activation protein [Cyanobacteriota bacterium]|nr:ShlB/FhaC/HecB family hemolysin secretion/activation protein [Cyanobacteriota bacterium]
MINRWIRGTGNAILAVGLLLLPGLPAPAQLPPAPESLGEEAPALILRGVRLTGNTAFATADLRSLWEPLLNQPVTETQLEGLAQGITQRYLEAGYLNSRARVDSFSPEGVAILSVREGELGTVVIEGAPRLETYIRDRVALGAGRPLNIRNLETQLRLLKADPLFKSIDASLRPPETPLEEGKDPETAPESNKTDLIVRVVEANPVFGQVGLDNYSPPSIGAVRLNLSAGYRNPTGLGDTVFVSYRPRLEAFLDSYRLDTFYQVPLNPQDGTLAFSVFIDRNKILTDEFTPLNIRGNSDRYVVEYRQPLIRTPDEELALSFGVSYDSGQTFALDQGVPFGFGPNAEGYSESSPLLFTQDYTVRDSVGVWALRSQFKFGTGLFGATNNPAPIPDGYFFAWLGQVQRLRQFSENNFLIMQLDTQFSANPLLPMEQFVIGGAQSVRGYRQNVLAGDNGVRFSIEDRIALVKDGENRAVFTLAPFFDFGAVWNAAGNPNQLGANKNMLAALGLGLIYQPIAGLTLRVDYAPPLINLNIRGNNIQDDGLYLGLNYEF